MFLGCTSTQKVFILSVATMVIVPVAVVSGTVTAFPADEIQKNQTINLSIRYQGASDLNTTRTLTGLVDDTPDGTTVTVDTTTNQGSDTLDGIINQTTDSLDETTDRATDGVNRTVDGLDDIINNTSNSTSGPINESSSEPINESLDRFIETTDRISDEIDQTTDAKVGEITDAIDTSDGLTDTVDRYVDGNVDIVNENINETVDTIDRNSNDVKDVISGINNTDTDSANETDPEPTDTPDQTSENTVESTRTSTTPESTPTPDEPVKTDDYPHDSVSETPQRNESRRVTTTIRNTGDTTTTDETDSQQHSPVSTENITPSVTSERDIGDNRSRKTAKPTDNKANNVSSTTSTTTVTASTNVTTTTTTTEATTTTTTALFLDREWSPSDDNTSRPANVPDDVSIQPNQSRQQHESGLEYEQSEYLNVSSLLSADSSETPFVPPPKTGVALGLTVIGVGAVVKHGNIVVEAVGTSVSTTSTGILTTVRLHFYDRVDNPLVRMFALFRYSRYDDSDPLEHEGRAYVFEVIEDTPGVYLSAVSAQTDCSLSTVRHHLRVLEQESLVMSVKVHGKRRFYPAYSEQVELTAALNDDATATVISALSRLGPASVSDLADALDRDPSTVTHHLQRLASDGIVVRERDGRTVMNRLPANIHAVLMDGVAANETESGNTVTSSAD
jgi:predicted transcriptional regulator